MGFAVFLQSLRLRATACARRFRRDNSANVAMMFGLSLVPLLIATGAGIDMARGVMIRQRMMEALDASALAVGNATSKPAACAANGTSNSSNACYQLRQLAQQYFDMNYDHSQDANYGAPKPVEITISGQQVQLSTSLPLKLTILGIAPLGFNAPDVGASSTVVWGQTRLWVALALDNSGSMDYGDSNGTKIAALKDALNNTDVGLLKTLRAAAANEGDVKVALVPFANTIRPGNAISTSYLDWGEWEAPPLAVGINPDNHNVMGFRNLSPATGVPFSAFGPGDYCPFTDSGNGQRDAYGFSCAEGEWNNANWVSKIPGSGNRSGYICPTRDSDRNPLQSHNGQFYNGCWTTTKVNGQTVAVTRKDSSANCSDAGFPSNSSNSNNCSCTGNGGNKQCFVQKWKHTWFSNDRSNWTGCVVDRQRSGWQTMTKTGPRVAASKDYDTSKDKPATGTPDTLFPTGNPNTCLSSPVLPFPTTWAASQWDTLRTAVSNMRAGGSTNQAIGVEHGWLMLSPGTPYGTPAVPDGVTRVLILFSDGLNTQNRWWGDGQTENSVKDGYIDDRTKAACTAAKNDGIVIYSIFVHIGSSGNSAALKACASSEDKYYDLTSSAGIKDAFKDIAQKITNLRVSQ